MNLSGIAQPGSHDLYSDTKALGNSAHGFLTLGAKEIDDIIHPVNYFGSLLTIDATVNIGGHLIPCQAPLELLDELGEIR